MIEMTSTVWLIYGIGFVITFVLLTVIGTRWFEKEKVPAGGIIVMSIAWPLTVIGAVVVIMAVIPVAGIVWVHDKLDDYVRSNM